MKPVRKFTIVLLTLFVFVFTFPSTVFAKKLLPSARRTTGGSTTRGVGVLVRFRGDRLAIIADFTNIALASSVSYTLSYNTNGTTQGAGGTINPATSGPTAERELLFGTCSHGVCRYDSRITNARLVVTTVLTNGKKVVKSFRLKI